MRVRVGRNLADFNLPGLMDQAERIKFETTMLKAFQTLIDDPEFKGTIYSMSPDHGEGVENPNKIDDAKYKELVDAHVMFKDMDADPFLKSAGISSDWPYGRGCYQSEDKECIIWFGEEDQLRIMCMKKGTKLNEVFDRLKKLLDKVESIEGITFAKSDKYGYVTSCPSNLGTGMRASVHIKLPNLTSDGTDAKAKEVWFRIIEPVLFCMSHALSCRHEAYLLRATPRPPIVRSVATFVILFSSSPHSQPPKCIKPLGETRYLATRETSSPT